MGSGNYDEGRIKRNILELFFYSFLQIKLQDERLKVKTEDKNSYGKFEGLFDSYKSFIQKYDIFKQTIVSEITEYAKIFKNNFDSTTIERQLIAEAGIDRINVIMYGLENTTSIPYVLYILKNVENEQERNQIFEYIESKIRDRNKQSTALLGMNSYSLEHLMPKSSYFCIAGTAKGFVL